MRPDEVHRPLVERPGRLALGTAVFGGMIAATVLPVIFVPVLYVLFQGLSERLKGKSNPTEPRPASAHQPQQAREERNDR
jgi:phosphoribosylcarboxyaminoimidazole (NCAIR) mutase